MTINTQTLPQLISDIDHLCSLVQKEKREYALDLLPEVITIMHFLLELKQLFRNLQAEREIQWVNELTVKLSLACSSLLTKPLSPAHESLSDREDDSFN